MVMIPLVTQGRLSTLDCEMEQTVESRTTIRVPQGGARAHLCLGTISELEINTLKIEMGWGKSMPCSRAHGQMVQSLTGRASGSSKPQPSKMHLFLALFLKVIFSILGKL